MAGWWCQRRHRVGSLRSRPRHTLCWGRAERRPISAVKVESADRSPRGPQSFTGGRLLFTGVGSGGWRGAARCPPYPPAPQWRRKRRSPSPTRHLELNRGRRLRPTSRWEAAQGCIPSSQPPCGPAAFGAPGHSDSVRRPRRWVGRGRRRQARRPAMGGLARRARRPADVPVRRAGKGGRVPVRRALQRFLSSHMI